MIRNAPPLHRGDFVPDADAKEFYCPVCGSELTQSDFDTPEREYYCPHCSTRQTPSPGRV